MFKSKIAIIILIAFLLVPFPAYAQTNKDEVQLRTLLLRVIDLLYQQIALLQAQIIELQKQQREITQQVQIVNPIPQDPLIEKKARYAELQSIFLEVTPSQIEGCREDNRNSYENRWWFLDCISPSSPYHKTPEQLNIYKELRRLEIDLSAN